MRRILAFLLAGSALLAQVPVLTNGGNAVGGSNNLTTVGAVPYVSASGVLSQDASNFYWDATNHRLGIGTASPIHAISNAGKYGGPTFVGSYLDVTTGIATLNANNDVQLSGGANGTLYITGSSGDVSVGTTSPGGFRLDVQRSGTNGTFRVYDQTATTGTTKAVIRVGAGDSSSTKLFTVQNNAGSNDLMWIDGSNSAPGLHGGSWYTLSQADPSVRIYNAGYVGWSSTNSSDSGSYDTCLGRVSAGLTSVTNCTASGWRDLIIRTMLFNGSGTTNANLTNFGPALLGRNGGGGSPVVANLTACGASGLGAWTHVTDSNTATYGATVAGGGANKVMIWCNGTNWTVMGI